MPQKKVTRVGLPAKPFSPSQSTLVKRVAAYARVSAVKDAQENSLQSQQEYFTEYIRHHPDWVFAGMYTDDGVSGLSIRRRDSFNRMVNDALDGKIDLILTKSLSRFARNTVDTLTTIRKLKAAGVAVYFQRENINTMDSTGEFLLTLMSSFAEEESRSISENVTWAVRHRYAQGIYHLPGLLLGYRRSLDGEIQVDEAGARVVRFIYLLALAEKSSTDICRILMEYNISSPGESKVWESKTVRSILKNEKYIGDAILQKQVTVDFLTKTSKPNEGEAPQYYVENSNPAIVSRETFQAAQNLLRSRKTERCKRKSYPLTGKLRCPECGRAFRHQVVNGKAHWIGSCRSSGATECQHRHVREDIVYDIFTDMVIKLKTYRGELLGTLIHQMETMQDRTSRNQERIRQIDKEIADLGARNHIIARLHTNGAINAVDYAMQTSEIGNRLTELRIERRQKLTEDEDDQLLATLKDLNGILDEYEPTVEFDNWLFDEIVESITVDSSEQLTFKLIGGITLTEQIPKKGR